MAAVRGMARPGIMAEVGGGVSGGQSPHRVHTGAVDDPSVSKSVFTITEKAPTRAFSWLKAATTTFTFKTLLRHYAERALTPQ